MLANPGAQIESDSVPDQPPANWYTDPTDESQYRYWDGSAWTEYRAPRYDEVVRQEAARPESTDWRLVANPASPVARLYGRRVAVGRRGSATFGSLSGQRRPGSDG